MRPRLPAIAVAVLIAAGACSSSDPATSGDGPAGSATSTTGPDPATEVDTTRPTTTTLAPQRVDCDESGPLPDDAIAVRAIDVDLNSDGIDERIVTFGRGFEDDPRPYKLRVIFGSGDGSEGYGETTLPVESAFTEVRPLGVTPGGTAIVAVDAGASTTVVTLALVVGCSPVLPSLPDRSGPALVPVGGTVGEAGGLGCETDGDGRELLVIRRASSEDGERYETEDLVLGRPRPGEASFLEVIREPGSIDTADDASTLANYYTIDCPGIDPI